MTYSISTTGKTILAVVLAAAVTVPTLAVAKGGRHMERPSFETLDADGNGELTQAELQARGQERFAAADANGDGFLTAEELQARVGERAANRIERMIERRDTNADGQLSLEEMSPDEDRIAERFARADKDGNGTISEAEFEEVMEKRRHHRGHRDDN
jgi:hypothetical protein